MVVNYVTLRLGHVLRFFSRAMLCQRALPSKDVRLAICPSHAGIVSKPLNLY